MDQFTRLILYDLRKDWWPTAPLFEITTVKGSTSGEQPTRRIRYRVQGALEYCVVDVDELLVVSQVLPGNPHGFRTRAWMCEHDVARHGETRKRILDSFQVTTRAAAYYTQFMSANGVTLKADGTVEPAAVEAGAELVAAMLSGRDDIVRCMARERAELAIIPKDRTLTSLPEYAYLKGTSDFTGRRRDNFDIRGVGAVPGQPVSSAAEEQGWDASDRGTHTTPTGAWWRFMSWRTASRTFASQRRTTGSGTGSTLRQCGQTCTRTPT